MPIYEFYCRHCDTLYNFFSSSANTDKIPYCPCCKTVALERQMSLFAKISGRNESADGGDVDFPNIDEGKMEKAMAMLEREAEKINDDDPRQAAKLMRKLTEATGLGMGAGMEEALSRLERGEDPEQIEAELGDSLNTEDFFAPGTKSFKSGTRTSKPKVDETLYDL